MATTLKEAGVPESQKGEHKNAKHHSRGKCRKCYNAFRKAQWQKKTKLSKQWTKNPCAAALVLKGASLFGMRTSRKTSRIGRSWKRSRYQSHVSNTFFGA